MVQVVQVVQAVRVVLAEPNKRPKMFQIFKMALILGPFLLFLVIFRPLPVNSGDYGTTGIIDVPSARMMNDGDLKTTVSKPCRAVGNAT